LPSKLIQSGRPCPAELGGRSGRGTFAAILDADHGLFRIAPDCEGWSSKQLYLPDTHVLITRFLMPDGVGEVQDFMPPPRAGAAAHRPILRQINPRSTDDALAHH
jgi:hypothetical protein